MEKLRNNSHINLLNNLINDCALMYDKTKNKYYEKKWYELIKEFNRLVTAGR